MLLTQVDDVLSFEHRLSREQEISHRANCVDVAACSRLLALHLLGRQVRNCAEERALVERWHRRRRHFGKRRHDTREPEVEHLEASIRCQPQVAWLQIAMNDSGVVCRRERTPQLDAEANALPLR